ncbi:MAG: hypothetical protein Kow00107_01520 [Planctomycetota bacterium]
MRSIFLALAAFAVVTFAYAVPASAQNFEIGVKLGVWAADDLDNVALPGEENDSSFITYGLVGQYNINDLFAVRLDIEVATSDDVDSTTFVISGIYNFMNRDESEWIPYGRLGIVVTDIDPSFSPAPSYDTEFGFEAAVGIAYFYQQFKFFAELGYRDVTFDGYMADDIDMNGVIFGAGAMFIF